MVKDGYNASTSYSLEPIALKPPDVKTGLVTTKYPALSLISHFSHVERPLLFAKLGLKLSVVCTTGRDSHQTTLPTVTHRHLNFGR